ncbi:MAG: prepilin-type N-terminal cleavage/methylation domain-containing protein [Patescibacteria group bacterium]|nr:prepilin-type N-terminal cleavage/methylation domain-containing protein [Patescibacteria group bacterium]
MRGFTVIEILITIAIIGLIAGILIQTFKPVVHYQKARDTKRLADLNMLESAIRSYILMTSTPSLGPTTTGYEESMPTIFISIPFDKEDIRSLTYSEGSKNFKIRQASSTTYLRNDGQGWLPINFRVLNYPPLFSLPADPLNVYARGKFFYSYVFRRSNSTFEINAKLESPFYKQGGNDDRTSTDNGNNTSTYEVGTDKSLVILDVLYTGLE